MAVFLTGSTGYIGSYLAASIAEQGLDSLNVLVRAAGSSRGRKAAVAGAPTASRFPDVS